MSKKNCVVITFDRHGQFDGPPYLATMEEAINDCLQFNIGHCGFCGESEQLSEDRGKVVDLMKKNQYKEAWKLWVDLSLVEECSRHMWWYELGKKPNPLLKAARNPNATPEGKLDKTLNGVIVDGGKVVPPKYEDLDNE